VIIPSMAIPVQTPMINRLSITGSSGISPGYCHKSYS